MGDEKQEARAEPKASISARVYRKETDTWEDLGMIAGPEQTQVIQQPEREG